MTPRAPVLQTMHEAEEKSMTRSHIEGGRGRIDCQGIKRRVLALYN